MGRRACHAAPDSTKDALSNAWEGGASGNPEAQLARRFGCGHETHKPPTAFGQRWRNRTSAGGLCLYVIASNEIHCNELPPYLNVKIAIAFQFWEGRFDNAGAGSRHRVRRLHVPRSEPLCRITKQKKDAKV